MADLSSLADALAGALSDVRTAIQLAQAMDGRTICIASPALKALHELIGAALIDEDQGFANAIAESALLDGNGDDHRPA